MLSRNPRRCFWPCSACRSCFCSPAGRQRRRKRFSSRFRARGQHPDTDARTIHEGTRERDAGAIRCPFSRSRMSGTDLRKTKGCSAGPSAFDSLETYPTLLAANSWPRATPGKSFPMQRRLNTRLLLWIVGALAVFCTSVHFLHAIQVRRHAATLHAQAVRAEEEGHPEQAATCWSRYLSFAPHDTDALARFGLALAPAANSPRARSRALAIFENVLDREPARDDIRREAMRLALDLGLLAEAGKHLQVLLLSAPENGAWHGLLGRCHEADGRFKDAVADYEKAIRFAPREIENYVRLASLLRFRLNQRERAGKVMDALVKANSESSQAYLERARYRRSGDSPAEAAQDIARARELASTDADVLLTAADVAQDLGKPEEARQALRQGLVAHPRDIRLPLRLAQLEEKNWPEEAIATLRQALHANPDNVDLLFALGELLANRR